MHKASYIKGMTNYCTHSEESYSIIAKTSVIFSMADIYLSISIAVRRARYLEIYFTASNGVGKRGSLKRKSHKKKGKKPSTSIEI